MTLENALAALDDYLINLKDGKMPIEDFRRRMVEIVRAVHEDGMGIGALEAIGLTPEIH
jgi:hypothetical protein